MATRIPINKDNCNFEDRQKKIWEDMEHDMERRRREWEGEIDKMRSDFFHMRPDNKAIGGGGGGPLDFDRLDSGPHGPPGMMTPPRLPAGMDNNGSEDGKPVIEKDDRGMPVFKVRFNMKDYRPEEVNVKMDSNKIMVSAKHAEKSSGSTISREYNREVNVPVEVDPLALQCLFQPDGLLVFTAPLSAPKYDAIKDSSSPASSVHSIPQASSVKSSSSYSSSSTGGSHNNKLNGSDGGRSNSPLSVNHHHQPQMNQQHHPHPHHNQHQQPKVLHVSQQRASAPSPSFPSNSSSSSSSTSTSKFNNSSHNNTSEPDIIVPTFRPPPDINKLLDAPITHHHATPPSLHASSMPKPPPFTNLSSTFPAGGPIFADSTNQIQLSNPTVTSHDGKFQLTMPIDDFKPEELTVKTQDRKVIICAKREVMSGSRNHSMEMNREHSLPDNVDPLTVKAFFTDTNMLIVEAPFLR